MIIHSAMCTSADQSPFGIGHPREFQDSQYNAPDAISDYPDEIGQVVRGLLTVKPESRFSVQKCMDMVRTGARDALAPGSSREEELRQQLAQLRGTANELEKELQQERAARQSVERQLQEAIRAKEAAEAQLVMQNATQTVECELAGARLAAVAVELELEQIAEVEAQQQQRARDELQWQVEVEEQQVQQRIFRDMAERQMAATRYKDLGEVQEKRELQRELAELLKLRQNEEANRNPHNLWNSR